MTPKIHEAIKSINEGLKIWDYFTFYYVF
jgi:hypothetical protein